MTVSGTTLQNTYTGDNTTTVFAFTFKVFDAASVKVYLNNVLQAAGYTLSAPPWPSGGNVVFAVAPTSAMTVKIERSSVYTQLVDLQNNVELPAESIEEIGDRRCLIEQELLKKYEKSIQIDSETLVNIKVLPVANGVLQFNATANGMNAVLPSILVPGTVMLSPFGQAWVQLADAAAAKDLLLIPGKNRLINTQFRVFQRGTPITSTSLFPNNDNAYCWDRWLLLSDGNSVANVSVGAAGAGAPAALGGGLTVVTPNKKFGILQIVDFYDSPVPSMIESGKVSLSFYAYSTGTTIANLRAAVLRWNGGVSTDPIATWEASGVNPTLIAPWAYQGVSANLPMTAGWQRYTLENVPTAGITTGNYIAVMIWCDDTNAIAGDNITITAVQLEEGAKATEYEDELWPQEIFRCYRFFRTSFAWMLGVYPSLGPSDRTGALTTVANGSGRFMWNLVLNPPMWRNPTVTLYNPVSATNTARNFTNATDVACGGGLTIYGANGITIQEAVPAGGNANDQFYLHYTANAEI
jgi:hypothetical protein